MADDRGMGDNRAPLYGPEELAGRLDLDHAKLIDEAADLELAGYGLPDVPQTDEEATRITDHVVKVRDLARRADAVRLETGKPYRDAQAVVNKFFDTQVIASCDASIRKLTTRIDDYRRARAARIKAEQAAEAARLAEEARQAEAKAAQARAAEEAARAAAEAAERKIAEAESPEERDAAEQAMHGALSEATQAAAQAEEHGATAIDSAIRSEAHGRATVRGVAGAASVAHGTTTWTYLIEDEAALRASMGPLAQWFDLEAIAKALRAAIRDDVRDGIPGVKIFEAERTTIRGTRS